jgi:hypothetical protein
MVNSVSFFFNGLGPKRRLSKLLSETPTEQSFLWNCRRSPSDTFIFLVTLRLIASWIIAPLSKAQSDCCVQRIHSFLWLRRVAEPHESLSTSHSWLSFAANKPLDCHVFDCCQSKAAEQCPVARLGHWLPGHVSSIDFRGAMQGQLCDWVHRCNEKVRGRAVGDA